MVLFALVSSLRRSPRATSVAGRCRVPFLDLTAGYEGPLEVGNPGVDYNGPLEVGNPGGDYDGPHEVGSWGSDYDGPLDVGSWGRDYRGPLEVGSWGRDYGGPGEGSLIALMDTSTLILAPPSGDIVNNSFLADNNVVMVEDVPVARFHKLFEMCYEPAPPGCVRRSVSQPLALHHMCMCMCMSHVHVHAHVTCACACTCHMCMCMHMSHVHAHVTCACACTCTALSS